MFSRLFPVSGLHIDFLRHDLVVGSYSVHTSAKALEAREAEIRRNGNRLRGPGLANESSETLQPHSRRFDQSSKRRCANLHHAGRT
jgi:hypothetical protein